MIQNLIIIKDGTAIVNEYFGECHRLNKDPMLLSAFFDAIMNFSAEFDQGILEYIKFKEATAGLLKKYNLLFVLIADKKDHDNIIDTKLKIIAKLFHEKYNDKIKQFSGEFSQFNSFKDQLIELEIAQYNCGNNSSCEQCEKKDNINVVLTEIVGKTSNKNNEVQ
ncbi:MAG: hypothetical protein JXA54_07335 [Candidatus Heimdallarchaeota archaeon]|nr:hypothetical protein [Candidatus Heimdallarchaeota archaeon]